MISEAQKLLDMYWISKDGEKWNAREGAMVACQVSDWDAHEYCDKCGKKIVHVRKITVDGKVMVVGKECMTDIFGYDTARYIEKKMQDEWYGAVGNSADHIKKTLVDANNYCRKYGVGRKLVVLDVNFSCVNIKQYYRFPAEFRGETTLYAMVPADYIDIIGSLKNLFGFRECAGANVEGELK